LLNEKLSLPAVEGQSFNFDTTYDNETKPVKKKIKNEANHFKIG
jgi:hypothetical protein